jgi:demethylmenaquinone methyltransferase/2-methoxy-6-polyprenyl-1,4-benzoquinol methylase
VLDCATGTGDLAIEFARAVGPSGEVIATDFCAEMMVPGPAKAARNDVSIRFEQADVLALPYDDDRFDVASISFGIRNTDDPVLALREMARVVRTGGRVVVLEFGQPTGLFGGLFRFYSRHIMPRVGGWISGNRDAYEYLPRTSAEFPAGERFAQLMQEADAFSKITAYSLTFGTAWLYVGEVGD